MDVLTGGLLFGAAVLGGAMSAIAGGASFFTFPALLFAGLPPLAANATNFVALTPANIAALPAYRRELRAIGGALVLPMIAAGLGGLVGALILLALGAAVFGNAVPYLMGTATILYAVAPRLRVLLERLGAGFSGRSLALALIFVVAIYGGYFGAGLGQFMLAVLMLNGYSEFHSANAAKNAINSVVSLVAVLVYGLTGDVVWPVAGIMMLGTSIGGFLGGHMSLRVPQFGLRWAVIFLGAFMSVYYFVNGV
jgi:uncharacterized membrane protein YfcA